MQNWLLQSGQYHQLLHSTWCHLLSSRQCHVNAGLAELSILQSSWCRHCAGMQLWAKLWLVEVRSISSCMLCSYHYLRSDPHSFCSWFIQWQDIFTFIISRLTVGPTHLHLVLRLRMSRAIPPLPHMLPWYTQGWLYLYIAFTVSSVPLTFLVHFSTSFSCIMISCFIYRIKDPAVATMKNTVCIVQNSHVLAVNYMWNIKFRYVGNDICKERTGWQNCVISEYLLWYPVHIMEVLHGFVFSFFIILTSKSNCVCTLKQLFQYIYDWACAAWQIYLKYGKIWFAAFGAG